MSLLQLAGIVLVFGTTLAFMTSLVHLEQFDDDFEWHFIKSSFLLVIISLGFVLIFFGR